MNRYATRWAMLLIATSLCLPRLAVGQVEGPAFRGTNAAMDSYFRGKTGIGTNAPGKQFHVVGDSRLQGGLTVDGAFRVPAGGDIGMGPYTNGVSDRGIVASNLALRGAWISYDGSGQGLFVATNGRVGVGTGTPAGALDVNGGAVLRGVLDMQGNRVTNVANGTVSNDAATLAQLWAATNGIWSSVLGDALRSNVTYNFTTSSSEATIRAALENLPANGMGHQVSVNFAAGVYTFTQGFNIAGKHNYSYIWVVGANAGAGPYTGQTTVFSNAQSAATIGSLLQFTACHNTSFQIYDIKFHNTHTNHGAVMGVQEADVTIADSYFCGVSNKSWAVWQADRGRTSFRRLGNTAGRRGTVLVFPESGVNTWVCKQDGHAGYWRRRTVYHGRQGESFIAVHNS